MQELPPQIVETDIPYDTNNSEAFVYKFINLITKMFYIGFHKGQPYDGYFHSSTNEDFNNDFTHPDGKFRYEVLQYGTEEYCKSVEHNLLKEIDAPNNPLCYNKTIGGSSLDLINVAMCRDIAHEIDSTKSYSGTKTTYKKLDSIPTFKLQVRDITVNAEQVRQLKDIINTKNTLQHLHVVILKNRKYENRQGDLVIGGNHSIQAAKQSKHAKTGMIPVLEISEDQHKDWSDDEVDLIANGLNPREENPRLQTNIETVAKQVGKLLNKGYDINSKEIKEIKKMFNITNVESTKINKLAKEYLNEVNPGFTNWIDYGRGTDDYKEMKKMIERENRKDGIFCRVYSSEKFGVTDAMENIYNDIQKKVHLDTFRIFIYFKDQTAKDNWENDLKEDMHREYLSYFFNSVNIKVEFEYMKTQKKSLTVQ